MSRAESRHDEKTRLLSLRPSIIGLDGIILSTSEANLLTPSGALYHQPDGLMFDPSTGILYNIEYKCSDRSNNRHKAKKQLTECEEVLKRVFPSYNIINLYIHDNYELEEVRS